ncbi:MAG: V-type ATPase subunit [Oscillospiraceae bacterium]|nr:V-type ATPase subunit [Oscillospiraceae bacterium]MDD3832734.1 V-type ATPase subunit [Oscillospiraceae bacterium]MDD4546257.1 V-type ATPase subunit [Oscillospiraceae bacterium]
MKEEKYVYAVSTIKVNEKTLLSTDFLEQLLSTRHHDDVRRQLVEHGWLGLSSDDDDAQLQKFLINSWELINEISPEPNLLEALVLKNDYHNLKAALKCSFSGVSPEKYFIKPCMFDVEEMASAVSDRNFDQLPSHMQAVALEAHGVYMRTQNGQYSETIIDTGALSAIREAGKCSESQLISFASELTCAAANVKTAVRAIRTQKDAHFFDTAICECDTLDKKELIAAALKGEEALLAYLDTTPYKEAVEILESGSDNHASLSAFEKWFDDRLTERIRATKSVFFGPDPLAAFYLAREIEIRNIRILLSGKRHEVDDLVIRERMRKLYV